MDINILKSNLFEIATEVTTYKQLGYKSNSYCLDDKKDIIGLNLINMQEQNILDYITLIDTLESLYLGTSIPKGIKNLKNLELLDINCEYLKEFPLEITEIPNLNSLALEKCEFSDFPPEIENLTKLTTLSITYSNSVKLNDNILSLKNLNNLTISHNNITTLPKEIKNLSNLNFLDISNNNLSSFPVEIENLLNLNFLDISNNNLSSFPVEIKNHLNLNTLHISSNAITKFPSIISHFKNLNRLEISNNNISILPTEIGNLEKLTFLNFDNNNISNLPTEIGNLLNLQYLYLSNNKLSHLPTEIGNLLNLKSFFISNNKLSSLPIEIGNLLNLESFYISNNNLTNLVSETGNLEKLDSLDISHNNLSTLPAEIGNLSELNMLDLSNNNIVSLPAEIRYLHKLRILTINSNKLSNLPQEISKISMLNTLQLNNNELRELIPELTNLKKLTTLEINENQFTIFPSEIFQFEQLDRLEISKNQLTTFNIEKGQLPNLSFLNISENKLAEIPKEIEYLTKLQYLYANNNQIDAISSEIKSLKKLALIELRHNEFIKFPEELLKVTSLKSIFLGFNHLTEISRDIVLLKNLRALDLEHNYISFIPDNIDYINVIDLNNNKLKEIPSTLFNKIKLKEEVTEQDEGIFVFNNPIIFPPLEFIEKGGDTLHTYIEALEEGSEELKEVKIIFIGEGSAGKTSIINRITKNIFNIDEPKTHGIRINQKIDKDKTIYFWDFGGQDIMHSTHQFFLSKRCVYVLVLDGRKDEKPKYWLDMIKSFGGDSPIFVALNKKEDSNVFDISQKDLHKQYPSIVNFIELNCLKENEQGTKKLEKELFNFIHTSNNEHLSLGTPIPTKWVKIKDTLLGSKENHQEYNMFDNLCTKYNIPQSHRKELISLLHELGIMLHFEGDLILENYYILKPKWVLDAAYKIINSPTIKLNKGELNESNILDILNFNDFKEFKKYPELENYTYNRLEGKFIITLFKVFKLGFMIDNKMLLPDLLSGDYHDYAPLNDYIYIIYQYVFMPASIMPQIIVNLNEDILNDIVWKQGVLLESKIFNCKAEIKADKERKTLHVKVSGDDKKEYLAIIRNTIEKIHKPFFDTIEAPNMLLKIEEKNTEPKPISYLYLKQLEKAGRLKFTPESANNSICKEYDIRELLGSVRSKEEEEFLLIQTVLQELLKLNEKVEKIEKKTIEEKILTLKANLGIAEINLESLYNKINDTLMRIHIKHL
ncbi:COR domain-containing protein [uncultured Arcobacter sp.]|uniref:leucine-rich repeat domain-containing protein n=1 Tax=uncultured Arcobacter sp. TaxID=165434 RepID=UPI002621387C|nr:COR domain-containing protein [uncultured Arcobacter sp.]